MSVYILAELRRLVRTRFLQRCAYCTESLGKVYHIGHANLGDPQSFSVEHIHDKVIEYIDPSSTDGGQLTREEAFFTNQQLDRIKQLRDHGYWTKHTMAYDGVKSIAHHLQTAGYSTHLSGSLVDVIEPLVAQ